MKYKLVEIDEMRELVSWSMTTLYKGMAIKGGGWPTSLPCFEFPHEEQIERRLRTYLETGVPIEEFRELYAKKRNELEIAIEVAFKNFRKEAYGVD